MLFRRLHLITRLLSVSLLATCGDGPTAGVPPSIDFQPDVVSFAPRQPSSVSVRAEVRGFGTAPVFRWRSLPPGDIIVTDSREGGAAVTLQAAMEPRSAGIELQVTDGRVTRTDTLPVMQLAAGRL